MKYSSLIFSLSIVLLTTSCVPNEELADIYGVKVRSSKRKVNSVSPAPSIPLRAAMPTTALGFSVREDLISSTSIGDGYSVRISVAIVFRSSNGQLVDTMDLSFVDEDGFLLTSRSIHRARSENTMVVEQEGEKHTYRGFVWLPVNKWKVCSRVGFQPLVNRN